MSYVIVCVCVCVTDRKICVGTESKCKFACVCGHVFMCRSVILELNQDFRVLVCLDMCVCACVCGKKGADISANTMLADLSLSLIRTGLSNSSLSTRTYLIHTTISLPLSHWNKMPTIWQLGFFLFKFYVQTPLPQITKLRRCVSCTGLVRRDWNNLRITGTSPLHNWSFAAVILEAYTNTEKKKCNAIMGKQNARLSFFFLAN